MVPPSMADDTLHFKVDESTRGDSKAVAWAAKAVDVALRAQASKRR